jgi:aminodeoxyfutalosine synthase
MASGKGCRPQAVGKFWLPAVQEDVKNFLFRANIRINSLLSLEYFLSQAPEPFIAIAQKLIEGQRLSAGDGLMLYQSSDLGWLGVLACYVKQQKSGNQVFFNKNFHIEPTNICIHHCRFCSYSCRTGDSNSWEKTIDDVVDAAKRYQHTDVTEVHIVGGVHPDRDTHYSTAMLQAVRAVLPKVHIKAFSAVELDYMFAKAGVTDSEGFNMLKQAGLQSIPGGGAEIFDESIREKICPEKTGSQRWLDIHRAAHRAGILSNATMLYGHIEQYPHRIDHLMRLRNLQDETHGFNAFIPLKYRSANNPLSYADEVTAVEDMKNYAVSRIFLDNIPHIKAYWPMIGRDMASLALAFGADDMDGTIDDTTKIYSMAGAADQKPAMTTAEMMEMIREAGYQPVERDSMYQKMIND